MSEKIALKYHLPMIYAVDTGNTMLKDCRRYKQELKRHPTIDR